MSKSFDDLAEELQLHIFWFLNRHSLASGVTRVSKNWNRLGNDKKLWEALLVRDFGYQESNDPLEVYLPSKEGPFAFDGSPTYSEQTLSEPKLIYKLLSELEQLPVEELLRNFRMTNLIKRSEKLVNKLLELIKQGEFINKLMQDITGGLNQQMSLEQQNAWHYAHEATWTISEITVLHRSLKWENKLLLMYTRGHPMLQTYLQYEKERIEFLPKLTSDDLYMILQRCLSTDDDEKTAKEIVTLLIYPEYDFLTKLGADNLVVLAEYTKFAEALSENEIMLNMLNLDHLYQIVDSIQNEFNEIKQSCEDPDQLETELSELVSIINKYIDIIRKRNPSLEDRLLEIIEWRNKANKSINPEDEEKSNDGAFSHL